MRPVRIRHLLVAAIGCTALLATPSSPANAAANQTPQAAGTGITMVNGAGTKITIPRLGATAAGASSFAGTGNAGNSGAAPTTKVTAKTPSAGNPVAGPKPNTVLGADGRALEGVPNTYPWRAITYMTSDIGQCTAFMMSRDVAVTAGHCVYDVPTHHWANNVRIVPAKNGASEPYGACTASWLDVWTTSAYMSSGSADTDYGLIKLTCDIGNTVGWFGWWYAPAENLVNQYFYVEGYPGDHPAQMWWDGDVVNAQSATRMFYSIDTAPGQSGSPVYHLNSVTPGLCGGWCVTGIHTYGPFDSAYNSGTRFTADVMSFINYWVGQP
jgi:glutamyl endopeptidase